MSQESPERAVFRRGERSTKMNKSEVEILSSQVISENPRARVSRAEVAVDGERERKRTFIIKEYMEAPGSKTKRVFAMYDAVHKALEPLQKDGIRATWETFRIESSRQPTRILMTDGEMQANDFVITANNESESKNELLGRITSLPNLEAALEIAERTALAAAEAGLEVPQDAWMGRFRVAPDNSAEVKFLLGDFDDVKLNRRGTVRDLSNVNVACFILTAVAMFKQVVRSEDLKACMDVMRNKFFEYAIDVLVAHALSQGQ